MCTEPDESASKQKSEDAKFLLDLECEKYINLTWDTADINESIFMYVLERHKKAEFAALQCSHVFPPLPPSSSFSHGREGKKFEFIYSAVSSAAATREFNSCVWQTNTAENNENCSIEWVRKSDRQKSIYAIDSSAHQFLGMLMSRNFFVFMQKVQLKFHSIALCLRNNFSKWLPALSRCHRVVVACLLLSDSLMSWCEKRVLLELRNLSYFVCSFVSNIFMFLYYFCPAISLTAAAPSFSLRSEPKYRDSCELLLIYFKIRTSRIFWNFHLKEFLHNYAKLTGEVRAVRLSWVPITVT